MLSAVTIQANNPCGPRWTALAGTAMTLLRVSSSNRALTNSPGHRRSSALGKMALSRVDRVVDQQQLAGAQREAVVLIEGDDLDRAAVHGLAHVVEDARRQREHD